MRSRRSSRHASQGDHVAFTYDRLGRKVTSTDQRGVVHAYAYDSAGRLETDCVTTLGGADGFIQSVKVAYDDVGRRAGPCGPVRL